MEKRWNELINRLVNINKSNQVNITFAYEILRSDYAHYKRHYHTFDHIEYLLKDLDKYFSDLLSPKQKDLVELAIWFHDIDYDTKAPVGINEKYSARRFELFAHIIKLDKETTKVIYDLIIATTHTKKQNTLMGKVICDLDLLGLAFTTEYFNNRTNVRKEYSEFNDNQWLEGRKKFLDWMIGKETIFQTGLFQKHFEQPARDNLNIELKYFYV